MDKATKTWIDLFWEKNKKAWKKIDKVLAKINKEKKWKE